MTANEFHQNMGGAETLLKYSDTLGIEYWEGYQRGLRRRYHGSTFGTDEEHNLWMALVDDAGDEARFMRGMGYRDGLAGVPVSTAIGRAQLSDN